jgi:hypothetical protein
MEEIKPVLFTGFQWGLLIFLTFCFINYIWLLFNTPYTTMYSGLKEGFESGATSESDKSKVTWFENDELFDDFYASVYDNLTQLSNRFPQQVALTVNQWKKLAKADTMDILDCGCGIGGPMRNIARYTHANIVGVTLNQVWNQNLLHCTTLV